MIVIIHPFFVTRRLSVKCFHRKNVELKPFFHHWSRRSHALLSSCTRVWSTQKMGPTTFDHKAEPLLPTNVVCVLFVWASMVSLLFSPLFSSWGLRRLKRATPSTKMKDGRRKKREKENIIKIRERCGEMLEKRWRG